MCVCVCVCVCVRVCVRVFVCDEPPLFTAKYGMAVKSGRDGSLLKDLKNNAARHQRQTQL